MNKGHLLVLLALVFLPLTGCATHRTAAEGSPYGSTIDMYPVERQEYYILEAPDVIEISVLPQSELDRTVTIRPDGKISLPLIGDVFVEGKTTEQVVQDLTEKFSTYVKNPAVSVIVSGFHSKKVFVVGEVYHQGAYPYTGTMTVFEVVEEAGSYTRRASIGRVILVRGDLENPEVIDVNLKDVVKRGIKRKDLNVQPSDIIYVPPNGFALAGYAIGQVLYPFNPLFDLGSNIHSVEAYGETF